MWGEMQKKEISVFCGMRFVIVLFWVFKSTFYFSLYYRFTFILTDHHRRGWDKLLIGKFKIKWWNSDYIYTYIVCIYLYVVCLHTLHITCISLCMCIYKYTDTHYWRNGCPVLSSKKQVLNCLLISSLNKRIINCERKMSSSEPLTLKNQCETPELIML